MGRGIRNLFNRDIGGDMPLFVAANTELRIDQTLVVVDSTAGAVTITLPQAPPCLGLIFVVVATTGGTNAVTIKAKEGTTLATADENNETTVLIGTGYGWNVMGAGAIANAGAGIVPGGSTGQVLSKKSATDYDVEWTNKNVGVVQAITANGAIAATTELATLNKADGALAVTIAAPSAGRFLVITQLDAGTHGHTVTLTSGTYDGTNLKATFNAAGKSLVLYGVSATRFLIVANIGSVALAAS